jgi:hypothetical protein
MTHKIPCNKKRNLNEEFRRFIFIPRHQAVFDTITQLIGLKEEIICLMIGEFEIRIIERIRQ